MNQQGMGLDLTVDPRTLEIRYGASVRGPEPEYRTLDAIRPSLMDPTCSGPSPVYSIAMDVRRAGDEEDLNSRSLLFGVVAYAAGQLGKEPVRSQGHVHTVAPHSGWSPPELYEVWEGKAVIYAQEFTNDGAGRCIAVTAGPGENVVVPPGWAHAVINAEPKQRMVFGAWCERQYGFDYSGIRAHGGLAYFPIVETDGSIGWTANPRYHVQGLQQRKSRTYPELGLQANQPLYAQFQANHESVQWVSEPGTFAALWPTFEP